MSRRPTTHVNFALRWASEKYERSYSGGENICDVCQLCNLSNFDKDMLRINIPKKYRSNYTNEHHYDENHSQVWKTYDKYGNLTHMKTTTGFEVWCTYDDLGQLIAYKDNTGAERGYDSGYLTYIKTNTGLEVNYEYLVENGVYTLVRVKDSNGYSNSITIGDLVAIQRQLESGINCINPYCIYHKMND